MEKQFVEFVSFNNKQATVDSLTWHIYCILKLYSVKETSISAMKKLLFHAGKLLAEISDKWYDKLFKDIFTKEAFDFVLSNWANLNATVVNASRNMVQRPFNRLTLSILFQCADQGKY